MSNKSIWGCEYDYQYKWVRVTILYEYYIKYRYEYEWVNEYMSTSHNKYNINI